MRKSLNINADTAGQSELRLLAAFDRLDVRLKNNRYLVGEHFSRADLTACALLSPYCLPEDAEAARVFPDAACALRDARCAQVPPILCLGAKNVCGASRA